MPPLKKKFFRASIKPFSTCQFMIGRELNPRIRDFDIKFFVELRPNLIGWLLMDICMAAKQYTDLGRVTNSMVLVVFAQVLYIVDALYNEVSARKAWNKKPYFCSGGPGGVHHQQQQIAS
jgi:Ergosterol biosynthesis ERG4/ERG24 family